MKTFKNCLKPVSEGICNRRSFIKKGVFISLGATLSSNLLLAVSPRSTSIEKQDKEKFRELDELVDKYLPRFGTCSQTSFYALNKAFDLNADEFVKSLASMPGIALRGETCGAVTGSLLAIALVYEEGIFDDERKRLSREPSNSFCSKFENKYSSTRCRDVIAQVTGKKYPLNKPEDYPLLGSEGVYNHCPGVIKEAMHIAAEIILNKNE